MDRLVAILIRRTVAALGHAIGAVPFVQDAEEPYDVFVDLPRIFFGQLSRRSGLPECECVLDLFGTYRHWTGVVRHAYSRLVRSNT